MKIRKQAYGNANMVGKNIEQLRKERGIKQKDFIAKMQGWGNNTHRTTTFIGRMKSEAYQPRS